MCYTRVVGQKNIWILDEILPDDIRESVEVRGAWPLHKTKRRENMKRIPLTIRMNESVAEDLRVQAAREVRTLGDIVEEALASQKEEKTMTTGTVATLAWQLSCQMGIGESIGELASAVGGETALIQQDIEGDLWALAEEQDALHDDSADSVEPAAWGKVELLTGDTVWFIITNGYSEWFDQEPDRVVGQKTKEGKTMKKDFAAQVYIDLEGGGFTAETLRCYGGSRIVFQGIYWDAETETEMEAELEVLLRDSVEDLLPEWEEATAEEIQEAAAHSWIESRLI
jgi:hypothetical protein